ncbi:hypothetical protein MLD38_024380 [Melastoma candidum]|uniref:Uncharacterized protein n=1 Tax=Melastoma candidum TaxID=119954 RepID=A0ACB9NS32_9MYRT|nr:hypothetical protein MLD38_024380 [Melastoma candidum]
MNRRTMLPAESASGCNPKPSSNPFVYPHDKTLLGYDDFHVMPVPRGVDEDGNDDEGLLRHIFSQHHLAIEGSGGEPVEATEEANKGMRVEVKTGQSTRKRASGKTDRHSKIRTAQGLRDRRIRLSVQVSRKFFDLQDMLGFDKASNTLEWLITKSRGAIKGLSLRRGSFSSKGAPEIDNQEVPHIEEVSSAEGKAVEGTQKGKSWAERSKVDTKRDSRERARVRARERTREKRTAETWNSGINEGQPNQSLNLSVLDGHRDFSSIDVIEKFLGITCGCESSLNADPSGSRRHYSENANYSGDDRFQDPYTGNGSDGHFGGHYP